MAVCKFFLNGNCRYGNNCWNEHPSGGGRGYSYTAQRNLFGGGGGAGGGGGGGGGRPQKIAFKDSFGNSPNPFKWQSSTFQNQGQGGGGQQQHTDPNDVIKVFIQEISSWESSKMWPFSSVAIDKDTASLPELEDLSPEELRLEAYESQKAGNFQTYTEKVQKMISDVLNKRNELKQATPQMKQKLISFLEDAKRKKTSSSAPNSAQSGSASLFGSGGDGNVSLFSQTASSTDQSSSVFGGGSTGIFGSGNVQTGSSSVFGGSTQQTGSALFGSNTANAGGLFGKGASTQQPTNISILNSSSTGNGGLFGKGVGTPHPQSSSTFGSNSSGGLFGKGASTPQPAGGIFGASSQAFGSPQSSGVFGGGIGNQVASPNVFGGGMTSTVLATPQPETNLSNITSAFTPNSTSTFGVGGAQQPSTVSQTVPNTPITSTVPRSSIYSLLNELTQEDLAQFQAPVFTLGKIPTKPPPKELVS